jgi:hypothetical protein
MTPCREDDGGYFLHAGSHGIGDPDGHCLQLVVPS